ncbi:hypothetical protein HY857_01415 [Candidatus Saccharibacteria bacterium]|nr:hypothetical protein [Candidatus Saccharibacteria bacterium]
MRVILRWIIGIIVAICVGVWLASGFMGSSSNQQPSPASSTSPTSGSATSPAPSQTTASPDESPLPRDSSPNGDVNVAVHSAALATDALWQAQIQTGDSLASSINNYVVPEMRDKFIQVDDKYGPAWANHYGFSSLGDAAANANLYVNTLEFKVVSFGNGDLKVMLYQVNHWYSYQIQGQEIHRQEWNVYGVSVIHMRLVEGRWLFADQSDPPANLDPPLKGLTSDQMDARFTQPLKERGFQKYVPAKATP